MSRIVASNRNPNGSCGPNKRRQSASIKKRAQSPISDLSKSINLCQIYVNSHKIKKTQRAFRLVNPSNDEYVRLSSFLSTNKNDDNLV